MAYSKEQNREYQRAWAAKNRDKVKAAKLKSRLKHADAYNDRRRRYRAENRARLDAAKRKWEAENPERVAATAVLSKLRRQRKRLATALVWHYDFTLPDYEAMLAAQGGRCAICGTDKGNYRGHRLHVDHCHETGIVRGLLCNRCNSAIGYLDDNPRRLRRAAAYLESARGQASAIRERGFQPLLGCVSEASSAQGRAESMDHSKSFTGDSGGDLICAGVAEASTELDEGSR